MTPYLFRKAAPGRTGDGKGSASAAALVFFLSLVVFSSGLPSFGITWDEPRGFFRGVFRFIDWLKDPSAIDRFWPLPDASGPRGVEFFNHPPLTRMLGALTWSALHPWLGDIAAMRMAAVGLFSAALALVFHLSALEHGKRAGALAALALATMPRAAGHAFVLSTDVTLLACWVAASWAYLRLRDHPRGWLAVGAALGLLVNAKFTGLLWLPAALAYDILIARRRDIRFWAGALVAGAALGLALNPAWWRDPWDGFWKRHVLLSMTRNTYVPITTWYWGRMTLPAWHYVPAMVLATLPALTAMGAAAALWTGRRRLGRASLLSFAAFQLAAMTAVFASPSAPRYDGVRLFAVLFPWIAVLAGIGFEEAAARVHPSSLRRALIALVGMTLAGGAWAAHPHEFSYYGGLAGGARGARTLGLESTYYWDAVTPAFCRRLNALLPPSASVRVHPGWADHFQFLQFSGWLRKDLDFSGQEGGYLLLLARQGQFTPEMREFYERREPLAVESYAGVPLVLLYQTPP